MIHDGWLMNSRWATTVSTRGVVCIYMFCLMLYICAHAVHLWCALMLLRAPKWGHSDGMGCACCGVSRRGKGIGEGWVGGVVLVGVGGMLGRGREIETLGYLRPSFAGSHRQSQVVPEVRTLFGVHAHRALCFFFALTFCFDPWV